MVKIGTSGPESDGKRTSSTLYRLEVLKIELFSTYGVQARILNSASSSVDI